MRMHRAVKQSKPSSGRPKSSTRGGEAVAVAARSPAPWAAGGSASGAPGIGQLTQRALRQGYWRGLGRARASEDLGASLRKQCNTGTRFESAARVLRPHPQPVPPPRYCALIALLRVARPAALIGSSAAPAGASAPSGSFGRSSVPNRPSNSVV